MNARNEFKRPFYRNREARRVLATAQQRFAAQVDAFVACWLERCATNIEAAQRLFETDNKPAPVRDGRDPRLISTLG